MALAVAGAHYWHRSGPQSPFGECEILSEIERITLHPDDVGIDVNVRVAKDIYPYAMIMSQDCDLAHDDWAREHLKTHANPPPSGDARTEWDQADRNARGKRLEGVLLCVAENETVVRRLSGVANTKQWQLAQSNQNERFHFLRSCAPAEDLLGIGFPELVLDFRRYFTVPPEELARRAALDDVAPGRAQRRSVLVSPYLEDVASRFFQFQARVALPDERRPD